jgi:hypothetical protein
MTRRRGGLNHSFEGIDTGHNLGYNVRSGAVPCADHRFKGGNTLTTGRAHRGALRVPIAALAAVILSIGVLALPAHSRGAAAAATEKSLNVAVIPGFTPPAYPGTHGVPPLPVGASQLSPYHFSELPASDVTVSALSKYDTVMLYAIRWADIPTSGQVAINAFAATHKVLIWDADDTGSQNYSTFIHPFSDVSSGQSFNGKPNDSVVSFPQGPDFLASDNPSSPYYLDPDQLVHDRHEINDMTAMSLGTKNWLPALVAANAVNRNGGWVLAWSYGVIGNHTGMTIYSGLDADAFGESGLNPNNDIKELALQLQAQFRTTPDTSCAPGCTLPSSGPGSSHAACSFAKRVPTHWVHGRVPITLKASTAAGVTGRVLSPKGRILASAKESGNLIHLRVKTKRLRSNRVSRLRAVVYVNGQKACTKSFKLKVDNTPPRVLFLRTLRSGQLHLAELRVSEVSSMTVVGRGVPHRKPVLISAHRTVKARLPLQVRHAQLNLRDRAGNRVVRKLVW